MGVAPFLFAQNELLARFNKSDIEIMVSI